MILVQGIQRAVKKGDAVIVRHIIRLHYQECFGWRRMEAAQFEIEGAVDECR